GVAQRRPGDHLGAPGGAEALLQVPGVRCPGAIADAQHGRAVTTVEHQVERGDRQRAIPGEEVARPPPGPAGRRHGPPAKSSARPTPCRTLRAPSAWCTATARAQTSGT